MLEGIRIIGGGPAGAAAALTIASSGGRPVVYEKSVFPRHKICGEFFTPEILPALERIGAAEAFLALHPARMAYAELHFSRHCRRFRLPEPAYGLSRYACDDFLLRMAVEQGAELRRERATGAAGPGVLAVGRSIVSRRGRRIFGFKAHFSGPSSDAVELHFFPGGYCGFSPIEGGRTNVCGVAAEELLQKYGFVVERLVESIPRLRGRLAPLEPVSRWLLVGPLRFGWAPRHGAGGLLAAGDAACFVDPFSGSGLLGAVQTGIWAGEAALRAAEGEDWSDCGAQHRRRCASFYGRQLVTTAIIRRLVSLGWAETLAGLLPGWLLFRLTRPRSSLNVRPRGEAFTGLSG